jgi:hypothetical protein
MESVFKGIRVENTEASRGPKSEAPLILVETHEEDLLLLCIEPLIILR